MPSILFNLTLVYESIFSNGIRELLCFLFISPFFSLQSVTSLIFVCCPIIFSGCVISFYLFVLCILVVSLKSASGISSGFIFLFVYFYFLISLLNSPVFYLSILGYYVLVSAICFMFIQSTSGVLLCGDWLNSCFSFFNFGSSAHSGIYYGQTPPPPYPGPGSFSLLPININSSDGTDSAISPTNSAPTISNFSFLGGILSLSDSSAADPLPILYSDWHTFSQEKQQFLRFNYKFENSCAGQDSGF